MYVYEIKNTINGKRYIGSTEWSNNRRLSNHRYLLRKGTHPNKHLQGAWDKYGEDAFEWNRLQTASSAEELEQLETEYTHQFNALDPQHGYNMVKVIGAPMSGRKHSEKTKKLMSRQRRGKKKSHDQRDRIRQSNKKTWNRLMQDGKFADAHRQVSGNAWRGKQLPSAVVEQLRRRGRENAQENSLQQRKLDYKPLISPTGDIYEVEPTMAEFCRRHNLRPAHVREMYRGIRPTHRGWRTT